MAYKLIDIPNHNLEEIINENIEKSEKILIVVSFIFQKCNDNPQNKPQKPELY